MWVVSVYERDGQYQFYVNEMQPDGIGNLYLAFEQLKQKLEAEGLFAEAQASDSPVSRRQSVSLLRRPGRLYAILLLHCNAEAQALRFCFIPPLCKACTQRRALCKGSRR